MKKLNRKKGFTIVELVIVIAVVGVLTAVLVPTFVNLTNRAKEAENQTFVRNLNTQMGIREATEGKNKTMYEAMMEAEDIGYNVEKLTPVNGNDVVWDSVANRFAIVDKDGKEVYSDGGIKGTGSQLWKIYAEMPETQTYSIYAKEGWEVKDVKNLKVGFDAGKNTGIATVSYVGTSSVSSIRESIEGRTPKMASSQGQEVAIRTNGGTLTIDAEKDTVCHYGEAQVVTLTSVANSYENGSVEQVNIKKGRLILTNSEESSVGTIYIQATDDSYDNVIIATQSGAKLPEMIARDDVTLPTGSNTKTVVTIQSNVNAEGKNPDKTETINLYATAGTTGNDVYEATNGYNVSSLALLVVEASSTDAKTKAAQQISDPKVVAKVSESKAAAKVKSAGELAAALTAKAKYINIIEDFSIPSFIDVSNSASIDGGNHTITCEAGATRVLRVTANDVNLKLQNIKFIGDTKTERGVQVDSNKTGVTLKLINVEISNISYYGVNISNGVDVDIYLDGCTITAWGALNLWSAKYDVVVKNSTLNGINDKTYNKYGWNDFATIVLEGDTTGKTNDHSSVVDVKLINTTITATSTQNNKQALFGFNSGATANNVSCENCTLKLDNSIYTYNYYDHGEGNKLFINDKQIDIETYYNNYLFNVRGYDAYIMYNSNNTLYGANLTFNDAITQSKLYYLRLEKNVTLEQTTVLQSSSAYNNYVFIYLQNHSINANNNTLVINDGTVVITDSYESLLTLFSTTDGYHIVEDTNGEDGPYVYFAEADE